ncbi:MAG: EF-hand domain-containing protein [Ardenticatenaceae bacterium]|nr:EF-hand domain-containing protein [Ardenticatenaceae bacterium]MCB8947683.1 EF-hand domain-containing protein [Ardenticatenaceae bacterium]
MLSEIMQKKLTRHFQFRDLNKDGFVQRSDWEQCARNLAALRGWQPDDDAYQDMMNRHVAMWQTFWQPADRDGDGKVTLEEYLNLADFQRRMGFEYEMKQVTHLFVAIFDTIDLDGDGQITRDEYKLFFEAWGIDTALAEAAYAQMDFNEDGRLSRGAFLQYGSNFYINDEPDVVGNYLFGPYE